MADRDAKESCRIVEVVQLIGGKWKLLILRQLIYGGVRRFGELRRDVDGITQTMLTTQLRALEADGLVTRTVFAEVPPRVEYEATAKAKDLDEFFQEMHRWGETYLPPADLETEQRIGAQA